MIKKLGILLLALIATVGLSSAVSAQPFTGPGYGPGTHYGPYGGHGGHNIIVINRHRYFPPFYRHFYRPHFFPPFYRFHHRFHYMPFYYRR